MSEYDQVFSTRTLVCEPPNEMTVCGATIRPQEGELVVAKEFEDAVELSLSNGERYLKYTIFRQTFEAAADGPQALIDATMALMRRKLASGEPPTP